MFGVSPAIIGLLKQMGDYLQTAIKRAAVDAASGVRPDPDALASWLEGEMQEWDPVMKGRRLADADTRKAAARLLAGLAVNLVSPGSAHERAA
jgi:hypothetical protein|tara:strand:+ start:19 stop:297 length:279 start_codon:yes stop_codon:yes gene_type:complete